MAQSSIPATGTHRPQQAPSDSRKTFKEILAEYLSDSDLANPKHITATYFTLFLILLSITTLVLETTKEINGTYRSLLITIDGIIMVIFTIEYLLRIWVATDTPPGEPGWRGALKYMRSFYGLVDLIAIAPFFIGMLFPFIHPGFFRVFRLLRILMLGRYFKSFPIIKRAIIDKKAEIFVSLQAVTVITIILSVIMYEIESAANSKHFTDIPKTLAWSISKFIHDAGGYGDFEPVTAYGQIIATIIGILGIAIFAIPAGLIASGFLHELEEEKKRKDIDTKRERLGKAFREVRNEYLDKDVPRKYITLVQAKSRLNLSEGDIISVAEQHKGIRLRYKRVNTTDSYPNALLIEHYDATADYGTLEQGDSHLITVISPNSYDETSIGHFSRCLARMLDATYISNELFGSDDGVDPEVACSFDRNAAYLQGKNGRSELEEFKSDIRKYVSDGTLAIIIRSMTNIERHLKLPHTDISPDNIPSFGTLIYNGLHTLIGEVNAITAVPVDAQGQKPGAQGACFQAEPFGRQLNDLHCFIQRERNANVISIYVHPELLEWSDLKHYYGAIRNLSETIGRILAKEDQQILIYQPKNYLMPGQMHGGTLSPEQNGSNHSS